jgi:hypothetical protein
MVGLGNLPGGAFQRFANPVSYDGSRVFGFSQSRCAALSRRADAGFR